MELIKVGDRKERSIKLNYELEEGLKMKLKECLRSNGDVFAYIPVEMPRTSLKITTHKIYVNLEMRTIK